MKYQTLKAGDVRQVGDEYTRKEPYTDSAAIVYHKGTAKVLWQDPEPNTWLPVNLINHPILPIDLKIATFRRPLQ